MTLYSMMNHYGLMTYLEYPIILSQTYVMMYLILKYKRMLNVPIIPLLTAFYFAGIGCFLMEIFPKELLSYLVVSSNTNYVDTEYFLFCFIICFLQIYFWTNL